MSPESVVGGQATIGYGPTGVVLGWLVGWRRGLFIRASFVPWGAGGLAWGSASWLAGLGCGGAATPTVDGRCLGG